MDESIEEILRILFVPMEVQRRVFKLSPKTTDFLFVVSLFVPFGLITTLGVIEIIINSAINK